MKRWTNWQDWSSLAIGGILVLAPLVLAAANAPRCTLGSTTWFYAPSTVDAWIFGILLIGVSVQALYSPGSTVTLWVRTVAGVWLFFAPWVLGFMTDSASAWLSWIAGASVIVLAVWQLLRMGTSKQQRLHSEPEGAA